MRKKITIYDLRDKKRRGEKILVFTAYDFLMAHWIEEAGIDVILVGDSVGRVVMGLEWLVPVTLDEVIHHAKAVSRGVRTPLLIGDLPFLSYQVSHEQAIANAGRFLKEAGMDAVKLEGGQEMADTIRAIVRAGIPVMGHIGTLVQYHSMQGGRVQGTDAITAARLMADAQALEEAGCFLILIDVVPARVGDWIASNLSIPAVSFGSGVCDGQLQVPHDLLGMFGPENRHKCNKRYADFYAEMVEVFRRFKEEVNSGVYPKPEHSYVIEEQEWETLLQGEATDGTSARPRG